MRGGGSPVRNVGQTPPMSETHRCPCVLIGLRFTSIICTGTRLDIGVAVGGDMQEGQGIRGFIWFHTSRLRLCDPGFGTCASVSHSD